MRAGLIVFGMAFVFAASLASAQQRVSETSSESANSFSLPDNRASSLLIQKATTANSDSRSGKKLRLGGSLLRAFKGRRIADLPRRVRHLINPFAPVERVEQFEKTRDINPRAWSTMVGLHPGGSAFPEATTHESTLGLSLRD